MKPLREILTGLCCVLVSAMIVSGALFTSISEGYFSEAIDQVSVVENGILTVLPEISTSQSQAIRSPHIITSTPPRQKTCAEPAGWVMYRVQPDDTLNELAVNRKTTIQQILNGNCLISMSLIPGSYIFLPRSIQPVAATTSRLLLSTTTISCGPPSSWIRYIVQPNDTLFKLSILFNVRISDLQVANCLVDTIIRVGSVLYVPNTPTRTQSPTSFLLISPTFPPSATRTISFTTTLFPNLTRTVTPTVTSTATITKTPTITSTHTLTIKPSKTSTFTPTRTFTITPTRTATITPTQTPTWTPTTISGGEQD